MSRKSQADKNKLSDKERAAVSFYFGEALYNETKAATMAGYKHADKVAHRVFGRPHVIAFVERQRAGLEKKYDISKERIAQELAALAFENLGDLVRKTGDGDAVLDFSDLTTGQRKAMSEFSAETYVEGRGPGAQRVKKNKVKFHSKQAALEALARLQGYTTENKNTMTDEAMVALLNAGRSRVKAE